MDEENKKLMAPSDSKISVKYLKVLNFKLLKNKLDLKEFKEKEFVSIDGVNSTQVLIICCDGAWKKSIVYHHFY